VIVFDVEPWSQVRPEMAHLWPAHYEEIATNRDKIKLDPDFESYANYEATGALHVVVARESGEIVGYHISIIRPHLHYKGSLSAFTDVYYLAPDQRRGLAGVKLFREVEKTLKARGVEKLFSGTKVSLNMGPIFERLGWTLTEHLYTKFIGD